MKKIFVFSIIAFTSIVANAQVAQEPVNKTIDISTKQKAKEVKKAASIQAVVQKRKAAKKLNIKKNR